MSESKPGIKRKSRKGVHITPHKGGRTERRLVPMTPETAADLDAILELEGKRRGLGKPLSFGDWVEEKVKKDIA